MLNRLLAPFVRLPYFRGKHRLESLLIRHVLAPEVTPVLHGLRMELDAFEGIQFKLLRREWMEPKTLELYGKLLQPGDVFVDVGAHVGFHTLVGRHFVGSAGKVIAVEPQPYNAGKILANCRLNGFSNVTVFVAAAGDHQAMVELHEQNQFERSMLSVRGGTGDLVQTFHVPLLPLAEILRLARVETIKLLKLDVEAYELEVLSGLDPYLQRVGNIVFELLSDAGGDDRSIRTLELLSRAGFELRTVEGNPYILGEPLPERNVWAHRVTVAT